MEVTAATMITPTRQGKSAQAVGQMAKGAVAEAKAAGVELPKNAQGMAASAIAQGADPSSVFAALVTPDPVSDAVASAEDVVDTNGEELSAPTGGDAADASASTGEDTTAAAKEGYRAAADATGTGLVPVEAEITLQLLKDAA